MPLTKLEQLVLGKIDNGTLSNFTSKDLHHFLEWIGTPAADNTPRKDLVQSTLTYILQDDMDGDRMRRDVIRLSQERYQTTGDEIAPAYEKEIEAQIKTMETDLKRIDKAFHAQIKTIDQKLQQDDVENEADLRRTRRLLSAYLKRNEKTFYSAKNLAIAGAVGLGALALGKLLTRDDVQIFLRTKFKIKKNLTEEEKKWQDWLVKNKDDIKEWKNEVPNKEEMEKFINRKPSILDKVLQKKQKATDTLRRFWIKANNNCTVEITNKILKEIFDVLGKGFVTGVLTEKYSRSIYLDKIVQVQNSQETEEEKNAQKDRLMHYLSLHDWLNNIPSMVKEKYLLDQETYVTEADLLICKWISTIPINNDVIPMPSIESQINDLK